MTNYRCAAASNRCKGVFTAIILSTLVSACSSSGSDDNNAPIVPLGNDNTPVPDNNNMLIPDNNNTQVPDNNMLVPDNNVIPPTTENISALINVAGVNGWVCDLGDGTFGAYSFYADLTGQFESLIANGDNTFSIGNTDEYTYVTTSASSVEILYEFSNGNSLTEVITNIAFDSEFSFTANSDLEGSLICSLRELITTSTESSVSAIPFGAPVAPSGIYF